MINNSITKIKNFYNINILENPTELFEVLKEILLFESGSIYLSEQLTYTCGDSIDYKYELSEELRIKNAPFGYIKIARNKPFTEIEKNDFSTCTVIIANIIKDIEISKIINMQVKALQEGISETNEAYQNEKNKNDFFANFSHELRTPLNSIISSSELLAEQFFGELNDKQLEYTNDIRIAGLHLLGMINDILDMAKLEAHSMKLNLTEFELSLAINEVLNITKPLTQKKNLSIIKTLDENIILHADYQKILQILFNLISNAIKYTPENGVITIITKKLKNQVSIRIKDTGIGIEKKYHKKIFEKFSQLGNQKNSNGLGLTITKELVNLHNGTITVNSEPQKGSEFVVTFENLATNINIW